MNDVPNIDTPVIIHKNFTRGSNLETPKPPLVLFQENLTAKQDYLSIFHVHKTLLEDRTVWCEKFQPASVNPLLEFLGLIGHNMAN